MASGWSITGQQETTDLDERGQAVPGVRVLFVTKHQIHLSVFIPRSRYTPDNVKAAVSQAVAHADAVSELKP